MDYDRVMVLQDGNLMEFNSPHKLLNRGDSLFSGMVNATGASTSALLKRIASKSFLETQHQKHPEVEATDRQQNEENTPKKKENKKKQSNRSVSFKILDTAASSDSDSNSNQYTFSET
jgi:hypothetical protein